MIHTLSIDVRHHASDVSSGRLAVSYDRFDGSHEQYAYTVSVGDRELASGTDLRLAPRADAYPWSQHVEAMCSLITFMLQDGERYDRSPDVSEEGWLFNKHVAAFASFMEGELGAVRDELTGGDDGGALEPADWDDSGETHPVTAIGNYQGWAIRMYGDNARGDEPDARYDAHVPEHNTLSPGFDTLADLLAWLGENEAHPVSAGLCACESGVRERAAYGNVHSDDELGR